MAYKEGWVIVNQVRTRVKTWGGWVESPLPEGDSVIICIPGNPGLTPFYHSFLEELHRLLGVPIWIPCHAGHELLPDTSPQQPSVYNMAAQVAHKVAFVQQYAPPNRHLYFIGHSLGAKLVSELLRKQQIAKNTKRCYLLMPTLERIAETPNGKFLTNILTYFMSAILFAAWVFSLFPDKCRVFLIHCWFLVTGQPYVDNTCMEAICHLTLPSVLKNVFNLALDEMKEITELDMQVLNDHCSKLKVYFAHADGWAPLSYMESLKKAKPEIDVSVLDDKFMHTFVLDNPEEMADVLAQQIKKDRVES